MASSWSITGTITRPTRVIWGIVLSFRTVRGYDRRMGEKSSLPPRLPGAAGRLARRGLVIRVLARGVVGHVDHALHLRHRGQDGRLDPLVEGDRRHAAALTTAAQAHVSGVALDAHEPGHAAVHRD